MTDSSFLAIMKQAGLRQKDVARLTGRNRCTVYRWCRGLSPVPDYAWTLVVQHIDRRQSS